MYGRLVAINGVSMKKYIAERRLLLALKGSDFQKEFTIRLSEPYSVQQSTVSFSIGKDGIWACQVQIEGVDEADREVYGADALQAIELASSSVEPFLKRLHKKYDLFYPSGEPYFDDPVT